MGHFKFNSRGGMSVDRDSLHASPEFKRQIEALSKLSGNPMTLPQNVADAVDTIWSATYAGSYERTAHNTIRAHLMNQEAEIAEGDALRERLALILTRTANALKGDPGEFSLHSWHDLPECAQALQDRLAAADAQLRLMYRVLSQAVCVACADDGSAKDHELDKLDGVLRDQGWITSAVVPSTPTDEQLQGAGDE